MPEFQIDTTINPPTARRRPRFYDRLLDELQARAIADGTGSSCCIIQKIGSIQAAARRRNIMYTSEKITQRTVDAGRAREEDLGSYLFWYLDKQDDPEAVDDDQEYAEDVG